MPYIKYVWAQPFEQVDALRPCLKVEIRRRRRRARIIHVRQTHPGPVTPEEFARMRVEEYDVVDGMAGRVVNFQAAASQVEYIAVPDDLQAFLGRGFDLAPQQLHALAED